VVDLFNARPLTHKTGAYMDGYCYWDYNRSRQSLTCPGPCWS